MMQNLNTPTRVTGDGVAIGLVVSTIVGYLPAIASLLSIIWLGLQIYYFIKDRQNKNKENK